MAPTPTGVLRRTETGFDLALNRTIVAAREDVWASLTESPRTELWFGPWERVSADTVRVTMAFEEGRPASDMTVEECVPPIRLSIRMTDEGQWPLRIRLTETENATIVELVHSCESTDQLGEIGPGWEYYLDMLIASRDSRPLPSFDDYYPSQQEYYSSLLPE